MTAKAPKRVDMQRLPLTAQKELRRRVVQLRQQGATYPAIAAEVGLSRTGVFNICKRFATKGEAAFVSDSRGRKPVSRFNPSVHDLDLTTRARNSLLAHGVTHIHDIARIGIRELRLAGVTLTSIDQALSAARALGRKKKPARQRPASRKFTPAADASIRQMRAEGKTFAEIGRALGISTERAHNRAKTLGDVSMDRIGGRRHRRKAIKEVPTALTET